MIILVIEFGDGHEETIQCKDLAVRENGNILYTDAKSGELVLLPVGYKKAFAKIKTRMGVKMKPSEPDFEANKKR